MMIKYRNSNESSRGDTGVIDQSIPHNLPQSLHVVDCSCSPQLRLAIRHLIQAPLPCSLVDKPLEFLA